MTTRLSQKPRVERTGITLFPEDRRKANELASRHYEGNLALLVRMLIRQAWEQETKKEEAA